MDCDRFDIALFHFPFSERDGRKIRPALVLSALDFNRAHDHAIMAMVTTAKQVSWPSDVTIELFREAGLTAPSVIRWKLFTLEQSLYLGRVGTLHATDAQRLRISMAAIMP